MWRMTYHQALDVDSGISGVAEWQWLTAFRDAHARVLASLSSLQHTGVDLSE